MSQLQISFTPAISFNGTELQVSGTGEVPAGDDQTDFIFAEMIDGTKVIDWLWESILTGRAFSDRADRESNLNGSQAHDLNLRGYGGVSADDVAGGWQRAVPWPVLLPTRTDLRSDKIAPEGNWPRDFGVESVFNGPAAESILTLIPGKARVLSIKRQPQILEDAKWNNFSSDIESEESITFSHEHSDSITLSSSETHAVGKTVEVNAEVNLPFGTAGGSASVTVDDSVENGQAHETSDGKISTGEIRATVGPGQGAVAALTAYTGTVEAEVDVIGVLTGDGKIEFGGVHSEKWGRWPIYNPPRYPGGGQGPLAHNDVLTMPWADWARFTGGITRSPLTTIRIRAQFLAQWDGAVYDVADFDQDTINRAIYPHNPSLDEETVYEVPGFRSSFS